MPAETGKVAHEANGKILVQTGKKLLVETIAHHCYENPVAYVALVETVTMTNEKPLSLDLHFLHAIMAMHTILIGKHPPESEIVIS